jgi:hypothetical protein
MSMRQVLQYVLGFSLVYVVCELAHVDWQLMLVALRDANSGRGYVSVHMI